MHDKETAEKVFSAFNLEPSYMNLQKETVKMHTFKTGNSGSAQKLDNLFNFPGFKALSADI